MTRRHALVLLLCLVAGAAMGGDIATFENLGFDQDGNVFVFGQYGIASGEARPFAEIYAVDVRNNRFLTGGVFSVTSDIPLTLGQDGRGALYGLMGKARALLERQRINHLVTGRPIYILVDGEEPRPRLSFRDFQAGLRYEVLLTQEARGTGTDTSATFHLDVNITRADGSVRSLRVGRPGYFRPGVSTYRVTQVIVGPDEKSLVFVIERRSSDGAIRYMVETTGL